MDNSFSISPSVKLHTASNSSFVIQHESRLTKAVQLTIVAVPPAFTNPLARELFAAVIDVLPREKAIHLMLEWKTSSRNYESELDLAVAEPQLHAAMRFILEQTGIFIEKHEKLPWKKKTTTINEDCVIDAKQRRPKASAEEIFEFSDNYVVSWADKTK
ncbi:unnamed protein product [Heligmosomoides polygyrus]|uniref:Uncharacterized protein n=1 Tax=Heligmosomoides polygyrus TaxID=6339 RepID=A0A183GRV8_HELPZ|nr:unnamed protein product [Heligmosomoides polygyrus]